MRVDDDASKRRATRIALILLVAVAAFGGVAVVVGRGAVLFAARDSSSARPAPRAIPSDTSPGASFPDETSTGVPRETTLTPSEALDIRLAGSVISGLDIDGCVDVEADNVTIRSSRITCARPTTAVRLFDGNRGLTLEDVEINGSGVVSAAVGFSNYTLLRVDIHDVIDGPRLGTNTTIQDSYVHRLVRAEGSHNDAVQITGGSDILIRHNRLEAYDDTTADLFNAAIMIGSSSAPVANVLIEDNYLDGGNYTVNFHPDLTATGIVGRNNVFGPHFRYGSLAGERVSGVEWSGEPN